MKKQDNTIFWIAGIALIIIIGINQGWFKSQTNIYINNMTTIEKLESQNNPSGVSCSLSVTPSVVNYGDRFTATVTDGANAYCEAYGKMVGTNDWRKLGEFRTDITGKFTYSDALLVSGDFIFAAICDSNGNGILDAQDCVTNQVTARVNPAPVDSSTCSDTDGKNKMTPGHATVNSSLYYYDQCNSDNTGVTEYWCEGNSLKNQLLICDAGYRCMQTRSGGECILGTNYQPGDELNDEQGIFNNLPGQTGNAFTITPILGTGDLPLCAKLYVGAVLSGSECLPGRPMVKFEFYDSTGKIWEHSDTVDFSTWSNPDLVHVSWDGQTPFRMVVTNKGYCNVNVNSKVQLLICP